MKGLIFLTFIYMGSVFACNPGVMVIGRSTSMGLSFGSGGSSIGASESTLMEIPVSHNGKRGCWKQKAGLKFSADFNEEGTLHGGKITIYPARSKFKKVKGGRTTTYLAIDDRGLDERRLLKSIQFELINFTCLGETVLAVQGYKGMLRDISEKDFAFNTRIAMGEDVVSGIELRYEDIVEAEKSQKSLMHKFAEKNEEMPIVTALNISMPSFLLRTDMRGSGFSYSSIHSNFAIKGYHQYGCTNVFESSMKEFNVKTWSQPIKDDLLQKAKYSDTILSKPKFKIKF